MPIYALLVHLYFRVSIRSCHYHVLLSRYSLCLDHSLTGGTRAAGFLVQADQGHQRWKMISCLVAYFEPRQLRGPLEKAISHFSRSLDISFNHRSGMKLSGFGNMVSSRCLKPTKIGNDEFMAFIIGASKFGALMASTAFPKHKSTTKVCG